MTDLIIIRGLPGSGKSTLAKMLAENAGYYHVEADQYFIDPFTKEYKFDKDKLPLAHKECLTRVEIALGLDNKVVVSNTFSRRWEYMKYVDLANQLRKSFTIIICPNIIRQNIHNVPAEVIENMRNRWEA